MITLASSVRTVGFGLILSSAYLAPAQNQASIDARPIRDSRALEALQAVFATLHTERSLPINDYVVTAVVEDLNHPSEQETAEFRGIGTLNALYRVQMPSGERAVELNPEGGRSRLNANVAARDLPPSLSLEAPPYFLIPFIEGAINDPNVGVTLAAPSTNASDALRVRVERRAASWQPGRAFLLEGHFEVYVDRTTNRITCITNDARQSNNLYKTVPHSVCYSDYHEDAGWVFPHLIRERNGHGLNVSFELKGVSINTNQQTSDLTIK